MSFVVVAVAGSAAISAGASIYSSQQQKKGAEGAASLMSDAYGQGIRTSEASKMDALAYLDPYRQYGLNAGSSLQQALYSPAQRQQQMADQRIQLQGEVDRLRALAPKWDTYQVFTGKNASERRAQSFTEEQNIANQKIAEAESKLATFETQAAAQPAAGSQGPQMEASPWYQFQADLLNQRQDRAFAARGLTGSGFEAEERRRGLIELGAGETERQFARLKGMYDVGANASAQGAGAITGTAQHVANMQVGAGQAQAQGVQGVAGANANMATGIANAANSAIGMGLNYMQFQNLINRNSTGVPNASQPGGHDPVMGTGYGSYGPEGDQRYDYLKPRDGWA